MSEFYQTHLKQWKAGGFDERWAISEQMWEWIENWKKEAEDALSSPIRFQSLEFGSGLSTILFCLSGFKHRAVETDGDWAERYWDRCWRVSGYRASVHYCPIHSTVWPNIATPPTGYDLILIDGPNGDRTRAARFAEYSISAEGVIIVDDVNREKDMKLARELADRLESRITFYNSSFDRSFAVIEVIQ